jgi:uncharacterized protein
MADRTIDLEALGLRSGEAAWREMEISPSPPVLGGEELGLEAESAAVRVDVSRTSAGFALRLRAQAVLVGTCARCLGPARLVAEVDAREVDQGEVSADDELSSPYVNNEILDPEIWLHDALVLALPERLICREDCAGLCEVCGISLNDLEPGTHVHERPPDPRFAKLRDLLE